MREPTEPLLSWVVLTMGDRVGPLSAAVQSIDGPSTHVTVVANGGGRAPDIPGVGASHVVLAENLGVPAGRDVGVRRTEGVIVGFLDDDAIAPPGAADRIIQEFQSDDGLGAVSLRLVDEDGVSSTRHVPRPGGRDPDRSGDVALFLGGACAIRRKAYDEAGGYFNDLFYGHEELELSWRLIDCGWSIRYLADVEVFHPRTTIERHARGWELTGRNRVWIARRTLPWPVAIVHVTTWLVLGTIRAPRGEARSAYVRGWRSGWTTGRIDRRPISWRTVWRLTRLGRPPIL